MSDRKTCFLLAVLAIGFTSESTKLWGWSKAVVMPAKAIFCCVGTIIAVQCMQNSCKYFREWAKLSLFSESYKDNLRTVLNPVWGPTTEELVNKAMELAEAKKMKQFMVPAATWSFAGAVFGSGSYFICKNMLDA